eukprot:Em0016g101a
MDLAGCPEVKGSPLLGAVGEGHLLEISLLYCAQHVATIMPAILPCPCTGRKNTKRLLSQTKDGRACITQQCHGYKS